MKIALIGYGKMGKAIEKTAIERGHEIVLKIKRENLQDFNKENLSNADVAIEFTSPESALNNVVKSMEWGVPVVCGSTGWNNKLHIAKEKCLEVGSAFLQASNFSVGVNIFFEINKQLASIMNDWQEYDVKMEEVHHTEKKDSPSGTAITIAEQILENLKRKKHWIEGQPKSDDEISITAFREPNVPGTHVVKYVSAIDDIEIKHTAHSRDGFALGAVLAAEFVQHRKGIFTMSDVLMK
ncbi:4-hydroxy-tetrahydrodipicolinate reductase [Taibaiella lutea]|uniref:4-hydroxy-tetrahydrodipicolinate reductase n=1 Tax=Taibaiella lutea TaxID=2608001 RepID=A0A5M6CAU3_9BACT|nr:4-hydroxy-tetrahydrodipicolinate reductase [Taibaiella lutea]KAA5532113.1 4-hydroxy-tetrahydrodipicolinate reductase [Taibaiella lutea]